MAFWWRFGDGVLNPQLQTTQLGKRGAPVPLAAEAQAEAGYEVEFEGGVAEDFLVALVEDVAEVAVGGHAVGEGVVEIEADVGVAGVGEEAEGDAVVGLNVEGLAAEIGGEIGAELVILERRRDGTGVARAAEERLADLVVGGGEAGGAVERQDGGMREKCNCR